MISFIFLVTLFEVSSRHVRHEASNTALSPALSQITITEQQSLRDNIQAASSKETVYAYVEYTKATDSFSVVITEGPPAKRQEKGVAWGSYGAHLHSGGWEKVDITTSELYEDEKQAFAAGYLEGALTHSRIWDLWSEGLPHHYEESDKQSIYAFMRRHDAFLRNQSTIYLARDPTHSTEMGRYWYMVWLVVAQLEGMVAGYRSQAPIDRDLSLLDFWMLNNDGDLMDIERFVTHGQQKVDQLSTQELVELLSVRNRCSALIKWTGTELLVAHTTWSDYSELFRIYKHYNFRFSPGERWIRSRRLSMSSYPGFISSTDDWYELESGLLVTETTFNILDETLYKLCAPDKGVMSWVRSLVANRLAWRAPDWAHLYSLHNSGTYNCQWMVIDYKNVKNMRGEVVMHKLPKDTLWVLEQLPGLVKAEDQTVVLNRKGYWASYNRPFYPTVNRLSLYEHYAERFKETPHSHLFSYQDCPRAQIFAREQRSIRNFGDMRRVMMLNDYRHDPLSRGCPGNAIAARFDLPPLPGSSCDLGQLANGATDCKITSTVLMESLSCWAKVGPSTSGVQPFSWSEFSQGKKPSAQPDRWDFPWQLLDPSSSHWTSL